MAASDLERFSQELAECIRDPACRELLDPQPYWVFGVNWITAVVVVAILIAILVSRKR